MNKVQQSTEQRDRTKLFWSLRGILFLSEWDVDAGYTTIKERFVWLQCQTNYWKRNISN